MSEISTQTTTYHAEIDGGQGGDTTLEATSLKDAMVQAIEWARDGDWPEQGCDIDVRVWKDDGNVDEERKKSVHIPSAEEALDEKLDEDGEVIAREVGEWSTEKLIVMDVECYYTHPNGGARGAHNRQDGDGQWREHPCSPTRKIDRSEARCIMLDWRYPVEEVAKVTRQIES